ncbi:LysM peptidoglycan-binding domain-containing protein [Sutcliffiella halmapala]|uniref:LysM peptidoglycan-binding domain-containing protein n=1 Tax=Sutcliffiella halmapala TaxID=79882 RepID=UPI00147457B3|nr:LysM peptidoglycan-binding domain-containing protein [Sutcliffiella halmapala]
MSTKKNNQDQADSLREKVEKTSAPLPTRSEIHAEKRKKTKWKIKFPIVRLIGITFILIPIAILAIDFNSKEENSLKSLLSLKGRVEPYDQISIPTKKVTAKPAENNSKSKEEEKETKEIDEQEIATTETVNTNVQLGSEKTDPADVKTNTKPSTNTNDNNTDESKEKVIDKEKIEENVEYTEHVVANGETLYRISMKYYNSRSGEKIISDYNNLINNQVNVGQTLIIPIKKVQ